MNRDRKGWRVWVAGAAVLVLLAAAGCSSGRPGERGAKRADQGVAQLRERLARTQRER